MIPYSVFGYDVLTTPNIQEIYNPVFQQDYDYWCVNKPDVLNEKIREIVDRERDEHFPTRSLREKRIIELQEQLSEAQIECQEATRKLTPAEWNIPTCGETKVLLGEDCVNHTFNCELHFGPHMIGESVDSQTISGCTCTEGYEFSGSACVEVKEEPVVVEPVVVEPPVVQPVIEPVVTPVVLPPVIQEPVVEIEEEPVEEVILDEATSTEELIIEEEPTEEPEEVIEETTIEEEPSRFQRMWRWFRGLF